MNMHNTSGAKTLAGDQTTAPVLYCEGYGFHIRAWAGQDWLSITDEQVRQMCEDAHLHGQPSGSTGMPACNPFHPEFMAGGPHLLWKAAFRVSAQAYREEEQLRAEIRRRRQLRWAA